MTLPRSDEADANTRFSKRPVLCTTLAIWREKSNIQVSVLAAGHNFEDMVRKPGRKLARGDENTLLFLPPRTRIFKTLLIFLAPPLYRTLQCYQRLT
jgi:hypothetical protein